MSRDFKYLLSSGPKRVLSGQVPFHCAGPVFSAKLRNIFDTDTASLATANRVGRIRCLGLFTLVFASLMIWRLYSLQGTEHLKWVKIASKQHHTSIEIQGARGTVVDTSGRTLAVSVPALAVGIHPQQIQNAVETAKRLAQVLEESPAEIKEKLASAKKFVWLARGVPAKKRAEIDALQVQGVEMFNEFRRYYPQGGIAGSVLGVVGTDGAGLSGVELQYDERLNASGYNLPVRRDARGRYLTVSALEEDQNSDQLLLRGLKVYLDRFTSPAVDDLGTGREPAREVLRREGSDIVLTIDSVIQGIVEEEFNRGKEESRAAKVFGLIMDAETGEVLAMAQSPGTDPNNRNRPAIAALRNFVIQDSFEPGSTLKPLVAAAALDEKLVRLDEMFDCEGGQYHVAGHIIRDVHPIGVVPFPQVLVRSSNICIAKIGQRLGKKRLYGALRRLGLGQRTEIELSGESDGILRGVGSWADIDVATHSFGQGVSVTALQLVRAYAAIANDGVMVKPTLIKGTGSAVESERVFSEKSARKISEILKEVTEDEHGTGRNAAISGMAVHGKTGTAQKARTDGRGYSSENILASFVGFVDGYEIGLKHKLVMLVAVDEPQVHPRWGGVVAAPVFRRSMERILSHLMTRDGMELRTASLASGDKEVG